MRRPLIVLAILSTVGGLVEIPRTLGNWPAFSHALHHVLPAAPHHAHSAMDELALQLVAVGVVFTGILLAYVIYLRRPALTEALGNFFPVRAVRAWWAAGWGFDAIYDWFIVRPYGFFARLNRDDITEEFYAGLVDFHQQGASVLSGFQNGQIRWYVMGIALGAAVTVAAVVLL
jgi:NADH-quinone oxidoreductase subunit L